MEKQELLDKIFELFDAYKTVHVESELNKLVDDYTETVEEHASDRQSRD